MARKKKSKGNKLSRMNEEERARYMQHRAELELEAKRRKQQLIATFTKNKLKHEGAFSKLNTAKINEKWRYVLRQIKCDELYKSVTHLCTSFDRIIQIKDAKISYLYDELKVADKDHRRLQENHIILINDIIGNYKQKLNDLHEMYKFHDIKVTYVAELTQLKNHVDRSCKEISKNIIQKNTAFTQKYSVRKTQNAVNIFSILYMQEDMTSDLVHKSSLNIDKMWKELHKVLNEYEETIVNKKKQHDYLKEQDDIYQVFIHQYPNEYLNKLNVIQSLKYNIQTLLLKRSERIEKLKKGDVDLKNKLKNVKHEFTITQMIDFSQLKQLTVVSNKILKHLNTVAEKTSTILKILKTCSNLEPLFFNLTKYFIQDGVSIEFADCNIPESCSKVNYFWKHYNQMKVGNILLKEENNKLCTENEKLKHELRTCLTVDFGILALNLVPSSIM